MKHLSLIAALCLTACSTTTALTDTQTVLTGAQAALNTYGIVKGLALVAEVSDPSIAPAIATSLTAADALVAKLQADVTAAQLDVTAIQGLVAQINAEAQAIQLQAAPVIKVVPATH